MSSKADKNSFSNINHENYFDYEYSEYFKWSAGGKFVYVKRVFKGGEELFWKIDGDGHPSDDGEPIGKRSYAAVKGGELCSF